MHQNKSLKVSFAKEKQSYESYKFVVLYKYVMYVERISRDSLNKSSVDNITLWAYLVSLLGESSVLIVSPKLHTTTY